MRNAFIRLEVGNRAEAVAYAVRQRWIAIAMGSEPKRSPAPFPAARRRTAITLPAYPGVGLSSTNDLSICGASPLADATTHKPLGRQIISATLT
jgi:hypothetical protein